MSAFLRTYEQAIEFLFARINYERAAGHAYSSDDLKLERMQRFLALLGSPQEQLPAIHVAGTKGKGSTCVMAAEMLSAAGLRTGLFTSPHISAFEERLVVDGVPPAPEHLVELVNRVIEPMERLDRLCEGRGPTYFELATALAWLYFLDRGAEIAVLEVGLGGRLDATNVCRPDVCVITNISRDHTNVLGSTVQQIAREKAGIVKQGVPVISGVAAGPAGEVVAEACRLKECELFRLGKEVQWRVAEGEALSPSGGSSPHIGSPASAPLSIDVETPWGNWRRVHVPLNGLHQGTNTALAIAAVALYGKRNLQIPYDAIYSGVSGVRWPARIELVSRAPQVIVDAAHNWASTAALMETLETQFTARRRILVFAATQEKDFAGMLRLLLPQFDSVILTQYQSNPRFVPVQELAALLQATTARPFHVACDAATAWRLARHLADANDLVCITGSFFIAAELREIVLDDQKATREITADRPELASAQSQPAQSDNQNARAPHGPRVD